MTINEFLISIFPMLPAPAALVGAVFAWVVYRRNLPRIKIDSMVGHRHGSYYITIAAINIGSQNLLLDNELSYFSIRNLLNNQSETFKLNFRDPSSGTFINHISANGGCLNAHFEFRYMFQVDKLIIVEKTKLKKWSISKKLRLDINNQITSLNVN